MSSIPPSLAALSVFPSDSEEDKDMEVMPMNLIMQLARCRGRLAGEEPPNPRRYIETAQIHYNHGTVMATSTNIATDMNMNTVTSTNMGMHTSTSTSMSMSTHMNMNTHEHSGSTLDHARGN